MAPPPQTPGNNDISNRRKSLHKRTLDQTNKPTAAKRRRTSKADGPVNPARKQQRKSAKPKKSGPGAGASQHRSIPEGATRPSKSVAQETLPNCGTIVEGLTVAGRVLLCVMTTLSKANVLSVRLKDLQAHVTACLVHTRRSNDVEETSDFYLMVGTLREKGMISLLVDGVVPGDHQETVPPQADIRLGKSSVEIEAALQSELVSHSNVYGELTNHVLNPNRSIDCEPIRKL